MEISFMGILLSGVGENESAFPNSQFLILNAQLPAFPIWFAFPLTTFHLDRMDDWNIQLRQDVCSQCQRAFAEKDAFHTVLSAHMGGYLRQDICCSCWDASGGASVREKAGVISHWQGVYEPPAPPPPDPLPKEDAESILRRMLERNDPAENEARFILAVMLERKRVFKHRETRQEAGKILVYEHLRTGEVFMIADPVLRLDQLQDVQRRVATMLQAGTAEIAQAPAATA